MVNPKKGRASTIKNISLHHSIHLSKTRLYSSLPNYPQIGKINVRCAFHRWLGHDTEKDVYFCSTCSMNLCVGCNKLFHITPNILSIRNSLKNQFKPKR